MNEMNKMNGEIIHTRNSTKNIDGMPHKGRKVHKMQNIDWILDTIEKENMNYPTAFIATLEILNAYWLSQPDEKQVNIDMFFRNANGETQVKNLTWRNPKYKRPKDGTATNAVMWLSDVPSINSQRGITGR